MQYHNDTIIKTQEDFFRELCTFHFICNVCVWEGAGDRTELQYIDPHSYGRQRCVFLVLLMLNRRPGGSAFCWVLAFSTTSYQQLLWTPTQSGASSPFGLMLYNELYNSSTSTHSPTRSLEWYVWSSSSGNNCHAVQRSLSSGVSVYESIMGFFYLVPFHQPRPLTRSLSITGHWNVLLPSGASLCNGMFARAEGQNTTLPALRLRPIIWLLPPPLPRSVMLLNDQHSFSVHPVMECR